jgi:hypothetical protein
MLFNIIIDIIQKKHMLFRLGIIFSVFTLFSNQTKVNMTPSVGNPPYPYGIEPLNRQADRWINVPLQDLESGRQHRPLRLSSNIGYDDHNRKSIWQKTVRACIILVTLLVASSFLAGVIYSIIKHD